MTTIEPTPIRRPQLGGTVCRVSGRPWRTPTTAPTPSTRSPHRRAAARIAIPILFTIALFSGCNRASQSNYVRLAGAQIPVELVEPWLATSSAPSFRIERVQPVYLSQHGFEALLRGECELACTDRPLAARELELFGDNPPLGARVAFYGFAFYVNTQNTIDGLFSGHIELLFKKRILDWREISNMQGPITLYGPRKDTRGGTLLARQAGIWFAEPTWTALDTDADVIAKVREDPLAMGFASIGRDGDGVRYVGLRMDRRDVPVLPSVESIEDDRYGLAKVIYVYWREPATPATRAALDFLFSPAGRAAIERTDVWPIDVARSRVPTPKPE